MVPTPALAPLAVSLDDAMGGLVVSGMLVVIGVLTMRQAFDRRRVRHLIMETPTEDIESLSLGPSEVTGRAVPAETSIRAPFSDDALQRPPEAVEDFFGGRGFDPIESLVSTLGLASNFDFTTGGGFTFDAGVRQGGDRRYYQNLIRPDETVYVFGTVQRLEGARSARNPEHLVIRRVPREDRDLEPLFMIADHSEARLAKQRRWSLLLFPVGAILTTAGLGGLLLVVSAVLGIDLQLF